MASYSKTFSTARLWVILAAGMLVSFGVLLYMGGEIYQKAPPIPEAVVSTSGETLFTREDIQTGQNVWQSVGGMQQGSIWGHGGYLAPDWSADWLHREAETLRASLLEQPMPGLDQEQIEALRSAALIKEMRENTYDPATGVITVSDLRAAAIKQVRAHYLDLYQGLSPESLKLRKAYAFPVHGTISQEEAEKLSAFYFWTAWGATTNRPGQDITYTSNWPHEPLVGNTPPASLLMWSIASVLLLLAAAGALIAFYAKQFDAWHDDIHPEEGMAKTDILGQAVVTPVMRATGKYFGLVCALFIVQIGLGIVTAHYAVEGQGLYGLPFAEYFPYSVTRTWHTQLAILWIVTGFLAAGLYIPPLVTGYDPKYQLFGVNFLFISLILIVAASFLGQWAAIHRFVEDLTVNFWFGHQGYEYIDLGRFWQIYLTIGLVLWAALVIRAVVPVLREKVNRSMAWLLIFAILGIALLYAPGLMWGQHTHIAIMEYWRWWIAHLWLEGIFEVFTAVIVSVMFVRMKILRLSTATVMVLFATIIFLFGGVLGTFHHLYFSGTPTSAIAIGAMISALEVVPLLVVGFEAYSRRQMEQNEAWEATYEGPFMFFAAVLFWNLVGAGIFGFLVNTPIALYYIQGLNTTANHAHGALFGVYGMLALGLVLFCSRGLTDVTRWNRKLLKTAFWCLNIGLAMMTFLSLLPQGSWQAYASIDQGYWFAREAAFMQSSIMKAFVWIRVPGDLVFAIGAGCFCWFLFRAYFPRTRAVPAPA